MPDSPDTQGNAETQEVPFVSFRGLEDLSVEDCRRFVDRLNFILDLEPEPNMQQVRDLAQEYGLGEGEPQHQELNSVREGAAQDTEGNIPLSQMVPVPNEPQASQEELGRGSGLLSRIRQSLLSIRRQGQTRNQVSEGVATRAQESRNGGIRRQVGGSLRLMAESPPAAVSRSNFQERGEREQRE